jgi:hypothetical protein
VIPGRRLGTDIRCRLASANSRKRSCATRRGGAARQRVGHGRRRGCRARHSPAPVDPQAGRLPPALVAARLLARLHRGQQPLGQRQSRMLASIGGERRLHHLRPRQHVAGHRDVLAQRCPAQSTQRSPVKAALRPCASIRCTCRCSVSVARGQVSTTALAAPRRLFQQLQPLGPVDRADEGLRRDGADAAARMCGTGGADGEEPAGDGDAEMAGRRDLGPTME